MAYNAGLGALTGKIFKAETMQYRNKLNLPEPAHGYFPGGGVPTAAGGHTALDAATIAAAAAAAAGTSAVAGAAVGAVDKAGVAIPGGGGFGQASMDGASAAAIQSAGLLSTDATERRRPGSGHRGDHRRRKQATRRAARRDAG